MTGVAAARAPERDRSTAVFAFDQVDLPLSVPALELLFARDRVVHGFELLEADEAVNTVSAGESLHLSSSMLVEPRDQV